MRFEFDPNKSRINFKKHGIDFQQAQRIWEGPVVELPAKTRHETRRLAIGKTEGVYWSAIITRRQERIRLISVRRARDEEKKLYRERIDNS